MKKGLESEFQWQPNLSFVPLILISVFVFFLFDLMWNFFTEFIYANFF